MAYDIGMIGLAVMGENLTLNFEKNGYSVIGYDISKERMNEFKTSRAKDKKIGFASSLTNLVSSLTKPRIVMMMIRAGDPVDEVIKQLLPLLETGDIIIDGGNSNYNDTSRRVNYLADHEIHFIGAGISGGEIGALNGPSIMPGGSKEAWITVKPMLQAIAAKTENNEICCKWIGPSGSGHFVKMVHNGIEYGDIQLITEAYHIMKDLLERSHDEMHEIFKKWNKGPLDSYLIEITSNILHVKDEDNAPLVTKILDTAGQKGTGKWTAINALNQGVPLSIISEAVGARFVSSLKEERMMAEQLYPKKKTPLSEDGNNVLGQLQQALYAAKILSYAQGFSLLKKASLTFDWDLQLGEIASIWKEGCIIRSVFLEDIERAYTNDQALPHLLFDSFFKQEITSHLDAYRNIVSLAIKHGIPVPSLSAGLSYFDSYTTGRLPANLLQAMRDYFGAHTYKRIDKNNDETFHTNWTNSRGKASSTSYDA